MATLVQLPTLVPTLVQPPDSSALDSGASTLVQPNFLATLVLVDSGALDSGAAAYSGAAQLFGERPDSSAAQLFGEPNETLDRPARCMSRYAPTSNASK